MANTAKNFLIMLNILDALKTSSKSVIQKTAETTSDLIGN